MIFFEDIIVGESVVVGRHIFTTENIKAFAGRYDPQLFHLDEAAAEASHFGALCASGWQTAIVSMRLLVEHRRALTEAARARGERVAQTGPAVDMRELTWLRPVYVGDTIEYRIEVADTRASDGHPGFGLMTLRTTGTNQKGEPVISFLTTSLVERRGAAR
ncbi:MAG: FAS1-like dehydratase domain-containing protein [Pseudolabrys sp.]